MLCEGLGQTLCQYILKIKVWGTQSILDQTFTDLLHQIYCQWECFTPQSYTLSKLPPSIFLLSYHNNITISPASASSCNKHLSIISDPSKYKSCEKYFLSSKESLTQWYQSENSHWDRYFPYLQLMGNSIATFDVSSLRWSSTSAIF